MRSENIFDKKKIGIGIDDFKSVIEKNYYFVDKSKLIEDTVADGVEEIRINPCRSTELKKIK